MQNKGIIRNQLKIRSTISNARFFLEIQQEFGSFDKYIWQFTKGTTMKNNWKNMDEIPVSTKESDAMSKDLKKRGFKFVGTTICYAFMQAAGMVNDHLVDCFRYNEVDRSFTPNDRIRKTVALLRKTTHLPISAKIRLGRKLDENILLDYCKMLEAEGVDMLTVHGRLDGEKFCRSPRWDWIGKVKNAVKVPVIANGGIFSVDDAKKCLERSGADGLMLGRGAVCKPWLFADIAKAVYNDHSTNDIVVSDLYFRFIELLEERFMPERRLGRLKKFTHYYSSNFTFGHHLASGVQNSRTVEEAAETAKHFFNTLQENNHD